MGRLFGHTLPPLHPRRLIGESAAAPTHRTGHGRPPGWAVADPTAASTPQRRGLHPSGPSTGPRSATGRIAHRRGCWVGRSTAVHLASCPTADPTGAREPVEDAVWGGGDRLNLRVPHQRTDRNTSGVAPQRPSSRRPPPVGTGRRSDPAIVHRRQSRRSRIAGTTATRAFVAVLTTLVAQIKPSLSTKKFLARSYLQFETLWCAIEPAWCPG